MSLFKRGPRMPAMNTMVVFTEYAGAQHEPGQVVRRGLGHVASAPPRTSHITIEVHEDPPEFPNPTREKTFDIDPADLGRWTFERPSNRVGYRPGETCYVFPGVDPEHGWDCYVWVCSCDFRPRYVHTVDGPQSAELANRAWDEHCEGGHRK